MSTAAPNLPVTAAEYLEGELRSEVRHEFVDGRIYAMSGASRKHNEICLETALILKDHLRGGPCRTYIEAVKVQIADDIGEAYYYPDVFVTCEPADDDSHIVRHPKLIIEILSHGTSRYDRGEKLAAYQRLPSVEEIVYIEQDWPEIFLLRRSDRWKKHIYTQPDSPVHLESVGLTLTVADFYRSAPFPDDVKRPWYLINREDG
ncbi:Uma2 family endonuclease [Luteolibacter flavescens]|uniref:Uma2 family endonuclease n=1 Tax=Luteolibacter flavescens TaxID=1859460 RepID=A0ABT3FVH1_9BACT|nr:Uma2 family endonuclease [Luteolibacter flavescens]MCW1887581.1 Uma2 family endonuclease [Luteolibacter flavescens]